MRNYTNMIRIIFFDIIDNIQVIAACFYLNFNSGFKILIIFHFGFKYNFVDTLFKM